MILKDKLYQDEDQVIPFRIENVEAIGRVVRLGPSIDEILTRHAYPDPVSKLLGEALLLVSMFGSMIKDRQSRQETGSPGKQKERIILQSQTDGPVNLLVADYVHPGRLRGYARFDASALQKLGDTPRTATLLGNGHLAITIDRGARRDRYQGITALKNDATDGGLAQAANQYFEQSEQLPTFIQLAMAKHFSPDTSTSTTEDHWSWRGGALMLQKLTSVGGIQSSTRGEDSWDRVHMLSQTLEDHELLDPLLPSLDLLYRLYHEDGVRTFETIPIKAQCSCSQEGVTNMLASFSKRDQAEMVEEDGKVHITCEFCNRDYEIELNP